MTDDRDLLEDRLRRGGVAVRDGVGFHPALDDVGRRSARQQRSRVVAGSIASIVVVVALVAGGLRLWSGADESVQTGPAAPASTAAPTSAPSPSTTAAVPVVPSSVVTTTVPTTAAPTPTTAPATTTTTVPAAPAIVLRGDGLGVASFGEPMDQAYASLVAVLGPPVEDSGWTDGLNQMDGRPNRYVSWGDLWVSFLDSDRGRVFAHWSYVHREGAWQPLDLATGDGIRLGMTYADVAARLGMTVPVSGEGASLLRVLSPAGNLYLSFDPPFNGYESSTPQAAARVNGIDAGDPMSAHEP